MKHLSEFAIEMERMPEWMKELYTCTKFHEIMDEARKVGEHVFFRNSTAGNQQSWMYGVITEVKLIQRINLVVINDKEMPSIDHDLEYSIQSYDSSGRLSPSVVDQYAIIFPVMPSVNSELRGNLLKHPDTAQFIMRFVQMTMFGHSGYGYTSEDGVV